MHILSPLIQVIQLLLALSVLVFVHELGHYLAARLFKVKVSKFFLFFDTGGRALWRYKSKRLGTEFGIGWLPLGGYCKIDGMVDEQYLETGVRSAPKPTDMRAKPAWQRLIIMIGGILFNLIFAILIYIGLSFAQGKYSLQSADVSQGMVFSKVGHQAGFHDNDVIVSVDGNKNLNVLDPNYIKDILQAKEVTVQRNGKDEVIALPNNLMQEVIGSGEGFLGLQVPFIADSILPNSPAAKAGMMANDKLLAVDTTAISDVSDAKLFLALNKEHAVPITVLRGQDTLSLEVTPNAEGTIGVMLKPIGNCYPLHHQKYSFMESVPIGTKRAFSTLFGYVGDMKYVFTKEGAKQMGGFISMGKMYNASFDWGAFWETTALLSLIFAFMNFLPIPMLDGAEILFLLVEVVSRRKIDEKIMIRFKYVGLLLLLFLFIWANVNDLLRIF